MRINNQDVLSITMKYLKLNVLLIFGLCFSLNAQSEPTAIEKALATAMPGVAIDSITQSPIPGMYEVVVGTGLFYISEDGQYLLKGTLFDIKNQRNLTEPKLASAVAGVIDKVGQENMVIFKAPNQKQAVSVFTDVDCGYCRKLHSEIDQYLAKGITIQYLFYPRAGEGSESYKKSVGVWCAEDRQTALTKAKKGESIESKGCENPVDEHMQLAAELGIRGTPMLITESGDVFPGYMSADDLSDALRLDSASQ